MSTSFPYSSNSLLGGAFFKKRSLLYVAAVLVLLPVCYHQAASRMDRQDERELAELDLPVVGSFKAGSKTVNRWGKLERRASPVQCNGGVQGIDFSNLQTCLDNAIKHTNCVPVCDSLFNTCDGCTALQADHDAQLALATSRCYQRAAFMCDLNVKANGKYDFVNFSSCCQSAIPFGDAACLCDHQQSSANSCYLFGSCLSTCATNSLRTTCTGTTSVLPVAPVTCDNPLAASCAGPGSGNDLSCVSGNYLYGGSGNCVTTCPYELYGTSSGICGQCGTNVATCSSPTVALTCGTGYNLLTGTTGGVTCVTTCGAGMGAVNGVCTVCPIGTYAQSNLCNPCPSNVISCTSPSSAILCKPNQVWQSGYCVPTCTYAPGSTTQGTAEETGPYWTYLHNVPSCVVTTFATNQLAVNMGASQCGPFTGATQSTQLYLSGPNGQCTSKNLCNIPNSGTLSQGTRGDGTAITLGTCTPCFDPNARYCSSAAQGATQVCGKTYTVTGTATQYYLNAAKLCVVKTDCPAGVTTKRSRLPPEPL